MPTETMWRNAHAPWGFVGKRSIIVCISWTSTPESPFEPMEKGLLLSLATTPQIGYISKVSNEIQNNFPLLF